jgi:RNA polymerase sigma factor (sigma-70 family)
LPANDDKYAFVRGLAASHGERLRKFLATRLHRARHDVPDLVQEVYMRLLRVERPDSIRNPEAYLFTIANHVLYQHTLRKLTSHETSNPETLDVAQDTGADPASQVELQQRLQEIDRALSQLSHKAQAALILYRRDGFSLEEVAQHLGVSLAMVKKYLAKAILHCRQQMPADD